MRPGFNRLGNFEFNSTLAQSNVKDLAIVEADAVTEPITLSQVKDHVRVTFSDDDALITRLISQCRQTVEQYCNISIVQKNIKATIDLITDLQLPLGPVVSVVSFVDSYGNTIDPGAYRLAGILFKCIKPGYASWYDAVIEYNAGYITGLEWQLQLAILNEIAFRYDNRGEGEQARNNVNPGICNAARALADPFKKMSWR